MLWEKYSLSPMFDARWCSEKTAAWCADNILWFADDDDNEKDEKPGSNHSWLETPLPWRLSQALQGPLSVTTGTQGPTHTENEVLLINTINFYHIFHFHSHFLPGTLVFRKYWTLPWWSIFEFSSSFLLIIVMITAFTILVIFKNSHLKLLEATGTEDCEEKRNDDKVARCCSNSHSQLKVKVK